MKFIDKIKESLFENSSQNYTKNNTTKNILLILIILVGMFIRIIGISDMPNALNCDEASAGYEAFSILNYGIDRNRK